MKAVKKSAVLYHYSCPDGAFAALAAHLYFKAASLPLAFFPNTVYEPIRAENLPVDEISDVYLLDFVGPSGFVDEISSKVESVTILDHHKTALEALSGYASVAKTVNKVIDMKRSGATIAYDYFKEKLLGKSDVSRNHGAVENIDINVRFVPDNDLERVQRLFKFIEDADLWRWALPYSKAFSSGFKDTNLELNTNVNPALFDQLLALDPDHIIVQGWDTLLHKEKLIMKALDQSCEIALGNGRFGQCLAVDTDSISNLRSELGNQLAIKSRNLKLRMMEWGLLPAGEAKKVYEKKLTKANQQKLRSPAKKVVSAKETTSVLVKTVKTTTKTVTNTPKKRKRGDSETDDDDDDFDLSKIKGKKQKASA